MIGLTHQQSECLGFIQTYAAKNGITPTVQEMADHLGLRSKSGIDRILTGLEDRGFVRRFYRRARSLQLLRASNVIICPHCGNIAGGAKCISAAKNTTVSYSGAKNPDLTIPGTASTGGAA